MYNRGFDNFTDCVLGTLFVGIVVLIFALIISVISDNNKEELYKIQCRNAGGTPVFNDGGINCAKEGFIDLHFE